MEKVALKRDPASQAQSAAFSAENKGCLPACARSLPALGTKQPFVRMGRPLSAILFDVKSPCRVQVQAAAGMLQAPDPGQPELLCKILISTCLSSAAAAAA
jgi:hypothetical protein